MKEGTSPEVLKARESRGEPRVGRVRGSGPCRGVIERPGGSRHDSCQRHDYHLRDQVHQSFYLQLGYLHCHWVDDWVLCSL